MRMTRVARPLAKVGYLGVLLTSAGFFCLPVGLRAQAVAVPAPVSVPPPAATLAAGDALEVKIQTQAALDVYLQLEKGGRQDAELLYRIAREYAELMPDAKTKEEKKRLGEIALDYAKRSVVADGADAKSYLSRAVCYGRLAPLMDDRTELEYSRFIKADAETALRLDPQLDDGDYILGAWNYGMANVGPVMRELAAVVYGRLPEASNEKAVEYLQKAMAISPQRVCHHIELGRVYAAMGKKDLARAEIEKGLALPILERDDEEMKQHGLDTLAVLDKKPMLFLPRH